MEVWFTIQNADKLYVKVIKWYNQEHIEIMKFRQRKKDKFNNVEENILFLSSYSF